MNSQSRMTLHVYRIAADGARTDLGRSTLHVDEPYTSPADTDPPCRCPRCVREREQGESGEAA
ncbi:hypothetical protein ACFW1A_24440 [Kitasatospora sp. NPDC058965]|uniref:hypothetical protein n=1 Tax=Kitasatospora sp. NPDC058965 TaxID=3346682 RepID=UPI0036CB407D